jgi:hypothetical protein
MNIHIVFNTADADILRQAAEIDETLSGEIKIVRDDYAVGPIKDLFTDEGKTTRMNWWKEVLAGGDYDGWVEKEVVRDDELVKELIEQLEQNPELQVWIWAAQNKHDVSGYYWLMSQLKTWNGRIYILYLNNLPFINDKGQLFYPQWISQILPKEMIKAKKLARTITPSEFEVDPDEWNKLANEEKDVRLLEGGKKLIQKDVHFYDNELKKYITADWQKASKIIHQFQNKSSQSTGDAFLLWRLKLLLQTDLYEVQGEIRNMKEFEIKKKAGVLFETETTHNP